MVILQQIALKNFKSFKGEHEVHCLAAFVAVVGPNGSGKSNFTDAICFVMGARPASLRVGRVNQLLYRSNQPTSPMDMSVKAVVRANDGNEVKFERSFTGSITVYSINDNAVPFKDYVESLKRIHINPRVNNFIAFQDCVDSILKMSPKERTVMFEEISGSQSFAAEYMRLSASLSQYKQELEYHLKSRKMIQTKIKALQVAKKNTKEYRALEKKRATEQVILTLFDLHGIERFLETSTIDVEHTLREIEELATKKLELEETLAVTVRRLKQENYKIEPIEREVKTMEYRAIEIAGEIQALDAAIEYAQNRVDFSRESYTSTLKADEARERTIAELREALDDIENKKVEYICRFCKIPARNLTISESQVKDYERFWYTGTMQTCMSACDDIVTARRFDTRNLLAQLQLAVELYSELELCKQNSEEYERLKDLFLKTCARDFERLASLERNYGSLEDRFVIVRQQTNEVEDAHARQLAFHLATRERLDKVEKRRDAIQDELEKQRKLGRDLDLKSQAFKEQKENLSRKIDELDDILLDAVEVTKMEKKMIVVQNLRQLFPGVYDRLGNMCKPIHKRYDLALTAVFGPQVNSIVVDSMATAVECTDYLKTKSLDVETFLALDCLKVQPLDKRLRTLKDPPDVKLLYDVIEFEPAAISRAILYVAGNTLVCETTEDAYRIATNLEMKPRRNCVSWQDGIHFATSGLISGGALDLSTRVLRYSSEDEATLQTRKKAMISALQDVRQNIPSDGELSDSRAQIKSLEDSARSINDAVGIVTRELIDEERRVWSLEDMCDDLKARLTIEEKALEGAKKEIKAFTSRIQAVENKIFAEFCQRNGIADIHQFEYGEEEHQKNIQDFDNQIDRIRKQLELETCRKTTSKVEMRKRKLADAEAMLRCAIEAKATFVRSSEYNDIKKNITHLEATYNNLKRTVENAEKEIKRLRASIRDLSEEYRAKTMKLNGLKTSIQKSKEKRHAILTEARIKGLKIPMIGSESRSSEIETSDRNGADFDAATLEESLDTYEGESIEFDYTKLPPALLELERSEAIRVRKELVARVAEISSEMEQIGNPNIKASQYLLLSAEKKKEIDENIRQTSAMSRRIAAEFEKVKTERYATFMEVFERVENRVDAIYKQLTRSKSAQTYLIPDNPEEPYLSNIHYDCVVPGKRFKSIEDLSGGEKVLASLPLLFAVQSSDTPTFQVLDEIDAALDNSNVKKVSAYIAKNKDDQQSIVVSHKPQLCAAADSLIGIVPKVTPIGMESKIFTLNLKPYRERKG